ncbi:hypothetical protein GUJ93_ZPchr0003g16605 [Zizania palustris]|uniref:Bifunctional inhibitor/plant lipid transfer protein/seed storage helical domain-containing protein n=1 Tax=Zizania palustris TaxID=103762 RepID=A0A8J5VEM7_ZIZPA|nr:hypothetical protein GUJ93_ZPchr0003g16605 [Zizania palustris]
MSNTDQAAQRIDAMAMIVPPVAVVAAAVALVVLTSLQPRAALAQISAAPWAAPASWPGAGGLDCTGALLNLSSCLTYVEPQSTLTRPEKGCCGALAGVLDGEAACLCGLVGGYGTYGVRVDAVRALALPTICRVDAPPPRLCAALGVPVTEQPGSAVPVESGSGMPATTPSTAAENGGGGGGTATHRPRRVHLLLVLPATLLL